MRAVVQVLVRSAPNSFCHDCLAHRSYRRRARGEGMAYPHRMEQRGRREGCRVLPGEPLRAKVVAQAGTSAPEEVLLFFGIIDFLQVAPNHDT